MGAVSLLVITDSTIQAMLDDPRFLELVPCLSGISTEFKTAKKNCNSCARKLQTLVRTTMNSAKNCLTALPRASQSKLKQLLNASKVRLVKYKNGQKVVITF